MFVKTVKVTIIKNQKSAIEKVVPAYEAELLKVIFGESNVLIDYSAKAQAVFEPEEISINDHYIVWTEDVDIEAEEERLVNAYVQKHIEQLHGANFSQKLKDAVGYAKTAIRKQSAEV